MMERRCIPALRRHSQGHQTLRRRAPPSHRPPRRRGHQQHLGVRQADQAPRRQDRRLQSDEDQGDRRGQRQDRQGRRLRACRSSCAAIICPASGCPHRPSKTTEPSPHAERPWSTSAPRSVTGFTRCWHAGSITAPAGGLFSVKGLAWLKKVELDPLDRALIDADLRLLEAIDASSRIASMP